MINTDKYEVLEKLVGFDCPSCRTKETNFNYIGSQHTELTNKRSHNMPLYNCEKCSSTLTEYNIYTFNGISPYTPSLMMAYSTFLAEGE